MENEMMIVKPEGLTRTELIQFCDMLQTNLLDMAQLIRQTNERLRLLENEVHSLTKVTPAQASELNAAIRQRASEVCKMHRASGCESATAAAIRKAMRTTCGTSTMRDVVRSDFKVVLQAVKMWDDYREMQKIKAKATKGKDGTRP